MRASVGGKVTTRQGICPGGTRAANDRRMDRRRLAPGSVGRAGVHRSVGRHVGHTGHLAQAGGLDAGALAGDDADLGQHAGHCDARWAWWAWGMGHGRGHGPAGDADAMRAVTVQVLHRLADEGVLVTKARPAKSAWPRFMPVSSTATPFSGNISTSASPTSATSTAWLVKSRASAVRRLCTFMAFMPASCAPSLYVTR